MLKIERPPKGDWTRYSQPQINNLGTPESGALYLYNNMGKQSVVFDWKRPSGLTRLHNLLEKADVLIDDLKLEDRANFGLDAESLTRLNGSLIDISLTPYGLSGPYEDWSSTPLVSLAMGGYAYLSGDPNREPLMLPGHQPQYLNGLKGYSGVMLALHDRRRSGCGQVVEVSEMETLAALHQFTTVLLTYDGVIRRRAGVRLSTAAQIGGYPITTLPCKDGFVTFSASAAQQWENLCCMMEREDLLADPRFSNFRALKPYADEIDDVLRGWIADKTRKEIVDIAAGVWSVPTSPVFELDEVLQDGQYADRGLFHEQEHASGETLTFPTVPFRLSKTPPIFNRAPLLNEHESKEFLEDVDVFPKMGTINNRGALGKRAERLLDGIRVIDLTRVWSGPLAARILSDFGAHVIKVLDPRVPLDRTYGTNNKLNRNKDGLAIRLDEPEGRDAFLELVSISDIVIESFRPHVMRNFGLDYEALANVKPDLIMCALSGYGSEGESAEFPAYGTSVESITGLPSLMGYLGETPMTSGIAYPDPVTALNAVASIMTALNHRDITGEGQYIDLALAEGPVCQIGEYIAASEKNGFQPERSGNTHHEWSPHGIYRTSGDDRWIAIAITSESEWSALCQIMDSPQLAVDDRFSSATARKKNENILNDLISKWTIDKINTVLMHDLQKKGIAAGAVLNSKDLLSDAHLNERNFFVELDESEVGSKIYPGQALNMRGIDKTSWSASSRLGEHNEVILGDLLGLATNRLSHLKDKGIIGSYLDF